MAYKFVPDATHASTGELVSRLSEQTSTLVRDEMRLTQAEMSKKAKHAFGTAIAGVVGGDVGEERLLSLTQGPTQAGDLTAPGVSPRPHLRYEEPL